MTPALIVVGADKGGVGKTTVSRLLLDYLAARKTPARAFDAEHPRGTLERFFPDITDIVDVTNTADQMRILDTLDNSGAKVSVLDVRAGHLGPTLKALEDVGFLEAAKEGQFTFCLFHVLGPSVASLDEIETTAPYVADANYFLVKNHYNDTTFFEWDPETYHGYFDEVAAAGEISIPKLDELAYEQVELAGVPFATFVDDKTADNKRAHNSFVLRGYVRTWMRQVADELDRVKLMEILAPPKQASRQKKR
ncbi:MAG TPA: hypothetical protein VH743_20415 [Beijerinckiaceae bacterium]|jgi:hypothetical protein